ncbi:MAG: hypothetical protein HYU66_25745 [Armatimonadetes bacterium]|nr:hypothetical protein [Armatimonadota bacterium]
MSNFRALGFDMASREDAELLARLPLREGTGYHVLSEQGQVQVFRLEVGGGIELWSVQQGNAVAAAFPTFLARGCREVTLRDLFFPHTPFTPRMWTDEPPGLAFQLVNYPFLPPALLVPGTVLCAALVALAGAGFERSDEAPGLTPPPRTGRVVPDNVYRLVGRVTATELIDNPRSGAQVRWWQLNGGEAGEFEAVCHADDAPGDIAVGETVAGVVTLRGAALAAVTEATGECTTTARQEGA